MTVVIKSYNTQVLETIRDASRFNKWWSSPLNLGGCPGPDGGSGLPIGGIYSQLIQTKVAYDTTEAAYQGILTNVPSGTLVDNLAHMRFDLIAVSGLIASGVWTPDGTNVYLRTGYTNVGVGITTPLKQVHVSDGNPVSASIVTPSSTDRIIVTSQTNASTALVSATDTAGYRGIYRGIRAGGTLASPTIPPTDAVIMSMLGTVYDGNGLQYVGEISIEIDGLCADNKTPTRIVFKTSPDISANRVERMRITASGRVSIGGVIPEGMLHIQTASAGAVIADVSADELILENDNDVGISLLSGPTDAARIIAGTASSATKGIFEFDNVGSAWRVIGPGGREYVEFGYSETIFNDGGEDINVRIESDNETHMFYLDAGNDRIGIATADPDATLDVQGDARLGHSNDGDYFETSISGFITLHGGARAIYHLAIGAPAWHLGAAAPTQGFDGVFDYLAFDDSTDDDVHFTVMVPYKWDNTTDLSFMVDWYYTGGQDNGTVCWALDYKSIKAGEAVTGGEYTIAKTSAGNHATGDMVRTMFTATISGVHLERADTLGLRLYRDVDGALDDGDTLTTDARMLNTHVHVTQSRLGEQV